MKETLKLQINNKKVIVDHNYADDTGKPFKDQKDGTTELKKWLAEEIVYRGQTQGFVPYNNFESSFNWRVVK